ncbi:MAG: GSCFA domain-containing protein [Deltaproteobacteria bacterium]|nr:GSCFA domain-containing protein [Deltaproteobacteria bacterium]
MAQELEYKESWLAKLTGRLAPELLAQAEVGHYLRVCPYPPEEIIGAFQGAKIINRDIPTVAIGSCFAQQLSGWLREKGYHLLPHPWGVIYNPLSFAQIVRQSFQPETWRPRELWWRLGGKYYDPFRKADDHRGSYPLGDTPEQAREALAAYAATSRRLLSAARLVVLTLGLTELWWNREDRAAFFGVPFREVHDPGRHEFHNLSYREVVECLLYSIDTLRRHNPRVRFLFSVSPVPLSLTYRGHLGPYVATQFSKSVLHAAVLEVQTARPEIYYMPSYEIVRNDPREHYTSDGRHIRPETVDFIMKSFERLYVEDPPPADGREAAGDSQAGPPPPGVRQG